MADRNRQLLRVLDAKYRDAQAKLHAIDAEIAEISAEIDDLRTRKADLYASDVPSLALDRFAAWIDHKIATLSSRQARRMVVKLGAQSDLQRSFGQKEAFARVLDQRDRAEKKRQANRQV